MAAEYVTFVGQAGDGTTLGVVVVTLYGPDGDLLMQLTSGPEVEPAPPVIPLEPGDYTAWVRADGHRFAWPTSFTVEEGDSTGPLLAQASVVVFEAASSSQAPSEEAPFCVEGWVRTSNEAAQPGNVVNPFGVQYEYGYTSPMSYRRPEVSFTQVGPSETSEMNSLQRRVTVRTFVDRNGYFSALLRPEMRYEAVVPGVAGVRYFVTGESGEIGVLEELITDSQSTSLFDIGQS